MRQIRHRARGFSLIELLIGMVIAMMGLAAVGSMMMTFSKKRSTVTQTMVAQDNGVMALYRLERDLAQAGYGLMPHDAPVRRLVRLITPPWRLL